ncbi:MAG: cytidylyltransferase domain-containing protein, partial [Crocinitomicaceae bacterium]
AERHSNSNLVINIQGDEPLINYQQLDELINEFKDPSVEIATLATPFKEEHEFKNQNRIKVVLNAERDALYFSRAAIPSNSHGNSQNNLRLKHIGVYAFRRDVLLKLAKLPLSNLEQEESLEQLRWMYHLWKIRVGITQIETPNIDTPEDLQTVLNKL